MAEYFVRITLRRPEAMRDQDWARLLRHEAEVGREYLRRGVWQRVWRIPGTTSNVGVWSAADASELDELLGGLPAFRFMIIEVQALATHYLEKEQLRPVG